MSKILIKQFSVKKPKTLTVEYIESLILEAGYKPLRWAIVNVENNNFILDTVVICST